MKYSLRAIRLTALALWVGGLVFFVVVASVAFRTMPDAHFAGLIVRGSLLSLHRIGLVAGAIYLFCTLGLLALGDTFVARAAEALLVAAMLAATLFLQQSVLPRMETDRLTMGGDVQGTPESNPARQRFDHLHNVSTQVEGFVLFGGLVLLCLAPLHGESRRDLVKATTE